ncbi:ABC transporter permease [Streptomyces sp. NPDC052503]|uniref:ABC transporter permease n=1 Tax=Streptomyces sp. NPDC052503 TaxID=3156683 RepID=UPI00136EAF2C|nr:ABC transporter permease [Streptomyces sp. SID7834]MYT56040.1 ABC transporter permease [Streptomyces sp. SID7834]MYT60732.1 ABC transporter permease [Streptomyces sp. SID7834]
MNVTGVLNGATSFFTATWFHIRDLSREKSDVALNLITPVFYACIAYFLYVAGGRQQNLVNLMIGAGLMGMWSTIMFGAGTVIKAQRYQGTLEFLLGSPKRLSSIVIPITTAASVFGAASMLLTYLWGVVVFDVRVIPSQAPGMVLAAVVTTLSMGAFGLLVAALFVQARRAESMASPMIAPLWMVSGILVPVSSLIEPLRPVSRVLPMSWGAEAVRAAAAGSPYLQALAWCAVTGVVYLFVGSWAINTVAKRSRHKGEINLW